TFQVMTNFDIGRRIVDHEQQRAKRAVYGAELLKELSARLTEEFGSGFSVTSLKLMRQFFVEYRQRIGQTVSDQSSRLLSIGQTVPYQLPSVQKQQQTSVKLAGAEIDQQPSGQIFNPFSLSWSHYV